MVGVVLLGACVFGGCHKKNRFEANTYNFTIDPPAVTVVKGATQVFTAHATSKAGEIDVSPTWTVSPSNMTLPTGEVVNTVSFLTSSIGTSVRLTPLALGDIVLTASANGMQTTASAAVVTYQPIATNFDVYMDALPTGSGILADIYVTPGTSYLSQMASGYTPQGVNYQHVEAGPIGYFWGVTLDKNNAGFKVDLSSMTGGSLKFSIRLGRAINPGEFIRVTVEDTLGAKGLATSSVVGKWAGFDPTLTNVWQEVTIQLSGFIPGINKTRVKVPFGMSFDGNISGPLTLDVDAVRWQK